MLNMLDNTNPPAPPATPSAPIAIIRDRAVRAGEIAKAICQGADCARCTYPQLGVGTDTGFRCACCAPEAFASAASGAKGEIAMVAILARNPTGADGRTARERAVLAIHALQTSAEQSADATITRNGAGWQSRDAAFGGDLARKILAGATLSERQSHYAFRLVLKYGAQLAAIAAARAARRAPAPAVEPAPAPQVPDLVVAPEPEKAKPAAKKSAAKKASKAPAAKKTPRKR